MRGMGCVCFFVFLTCDICSSASYGTVFFLSDLFLLYLVKELMASLAWWRRRVIKPVAIFCQGVLCFSHIWFSAMIMLLFLFTLPVSALSEARKVNRIAIFSF
jgi:hypothetical protein